MPGRTQQSNLNIKVEVVTRVKGAFALEGETVPPGFAISAFTHPPSWL